MTGAKGSEICFADHRNGLTGKGTKVICLCGGKFSLHARAAGQSNQEEHTELVK
jgi:hypothetical protein